MKSERRHELQENALAAWLTKVIEKVKPFSQAIIGGVILVILGVVAFQVLTMEGAQEKNLGWEKVFSAIDDDDQESLEATAKDNADRASGQWAALLAAQQYLQAASEVAFSTPDSESLDLQKAISLYDTLIAGTDDKKDKFLKTKALFGKAQALELKATDKALDSAKETYAKIADVWPDSAAAKEAQRRINSLNDPQITGPDGFYAWYRGQEFNSTGARPGFPDISLENIDDSDLVPGSLLTDPLIPSDLKKLPGTEPAPGTPEETPDNEPLVPSKFTDPKEADGTETDGTKAAEEKAAPATEKVEEKTAEPAKATEEATDNKPLVPSKFTDPKEADGTKAAEEKAAPAAEKVEEKTAEPAEATEEAAEEETTEEDSASE
ncbi:MAG: hypothetical protein COA78_30035 [Blastopirellula sp.]|nr:MAG: hypothetical protein COA78_30035 [Blastopirellula sp.]